MLKRCSFTSMVLVLVGPTRFPASASVLHPSLSAMQLWGHSHCVHCSYFSGDWMEWRVRVRCYQFTKYTCKYVVYREPSGDTNHSYLFVLFTSCWMTGERPQGEKVVENLEVGGWCQVLVNLHSLGLPSPSLFAQLRLNRPFSIML